MSLLYEVGWAETSRLRANRALDAPSRTRKKALMDVLALVAALGLVLLNGFFVATEFAIVKVRPTRIEELLRSGRPGARAVRSMVRNLDAYLSVTQLGITVASLGLGMLGEPAFERLIRGPLHAVGIDDEWWLEKTTLALTFGIITVLHITIGELAPKSLALLRAESVAMFAAWPMRVLYIVFFPFSWVLNGMSSQLLGLLGLRSSHGPDTHTEEEIKIILSQARSAGLLSGERAEILQKAMSLPSKDARHLMVPRNEVVFVDLNLPLKENLKRAMETQHTRFPLCRRELDEVIGIVDIRAILYDRGGDTSDLDLESLAQPVAYFPETMSGERLLKEFRERHIRMAIIVDEYGGTSGIVTPSDIVTMVMGEIDEEDDTDVVALPGGAYDVDGTAPLEEVEEVLQIEIETHDMRTVAGFLMERLGRMPRAGDRVFEGPYCFHVVEVRGPRVRRVRIQREIGGKSIAKSGLPTS